MLQDNGIKKVKLFDTDYNTMSALAGSGIEVMVAIPNDMLATMNDYDSAKLWVKKNVTRFNFEGGVNITWVFKHSQIVSSFELESDAVLTKHFSLSDNLKLFSFQSMQIEFLILGMIFNQFMTLF